jgi:hypothetical protein
MNKGNHYPDEGSPSTLNNSKYIQSIWIGGQAGLSDRARFRIRAKCRKGEPNISTYSPMLYFFLCFVTSIFKRKKAARIKMVDEGEELRRGTGHRGVTSRR